MTCASLAQPKAAKTAAAKKPAAKKKPAPSLTAQLKAAKAELKATKAGLITALENLESARTRAADMECLAASYSSSVLTPEGMIAALGAYRTAHSLDSVTDTVLLRLANRLTNLG